MDQIYIDCESEENNIQSNRVQNKVKGIEQFQRRTSYSICELYRKLGQRIKEVGRQFQLFPVSYLPFSLKRAPISCTRPLIYPKGISLPAVIL